MKNRSQLTREELLAEIEFAEAILDGCGADEGLTLWGRIASIKERLTKRAPDLKRAVRKSKQLSKPSHKPLTQTVRLLMQKYRTIVADPPWKYDGRGLGSAKSHRPNSYGASPSSEERYGSMSMEELYNLDVAKLAETEAHLYLWVTNAFVERGWNLCKHWGFSPKTIVTWGKLRKADGKPSMKTGYYFRGATEHFIFATRKNLRLKDKSVEPTLFLSERLPHSVKPEWFYSLVERCSYPEYLEIFSRRSRFGWDVFGNEVESNVEIPVRSLTPREPDKN